MAYLTYRKGIKPNKITESQKWQVVDMYLEREDLSQVDIARILGIGATTVGCILKAYYQRIGKVKPNRSSRLRSKSLRDTLLNNPEIIENRIYGEQPTIKHEQPDLRTIINITLRGDLKTVNGIFMLKGRPTNLTGIIQEVNRRRKDKGQDQITTNPMWEV